jgi:hypothetical protein
LKPDEANKVSEEDLFAALVHERVQKLKGDQGLEEFKGMMEQATSALRKPDGSVSMEEAAKAALLKMRAAEKLSSEEVDSIYSQAFAGAQLDGNTEALFDNRGGKGDPTIAVASMEQALLMSRAAIGDFDSGKNTAKNRSINEASTGKAFISSGTASGTTGDAGFLFKPVSDSDGKLAVLLPPRLTGLATAVRLLSPTGDILENGRYTGNGNGGREHFRFNKPGGSYPDGLTVEVTLRTGDVVRYVIQETSARDEGGGSPSSTNNASSSKENDAKQKQPDREDQSL